MAAEQTSQSFADTGAARLLALGIAVFCAFVIFASYPNELRNLFSPTPESGLPVTNIDTTPETAADPELAACLQQRVGDVDRMKEEGILTDEKYAAFRSRAEQLCIQQHS